MGAYNQPAVIIFLSVASLALSITAVATTFWLDGRIHVIIQGDPAEQAPLLVSAHLGLFRGCWKTEFLPWICNDYGWDGLPSKNIYFVHGR